VARLIAVSMGQPYSGRETGIGYCGEPLAQNNFLPLLESLFDAGYSVSL
jgi:hypothetical protein